jgi:cobalamin biosynthesis protein CobD/CbiB
MNTAEQILVVVLAATLAILLVLIIIATVYVIQLIKTLQKIVTKAEHLVESAEEVSDIVRRTAGKLSLLRLVQSVVDMVHTKSK